MSAILVLPTFNEKENLPNLVREIFDLKLDLDILVIDDNSPDGTGQLVDALIPDFPRLKVIHREGKLGLGSAYKRGFKYAMEHDYANILTMDADFSHRPKYLPAMIEAGQSHDLIIGSRYVPGGGAQNWTIARHIISRSANLYAKLLLGIKANDCTAGFRCYKRRVLEEIHPETILSSGYSFLVEMLYRCESKGFSIYEVPIIFIDRFAGKSKISKNEISKAIKTVLRLRFLG